MFTARGFKPDSCRAMASTSWAGGPGSAASVGRGRQNNAMSINAFFMELLSLGLALSGTRISSPAGQDRNGVAGGGYTSSVLSSEMPIQ